MHLTIGFVDGTLLFQLSICSASQKNRNEMENKIKKAKRNVNYERVNNLPSQELLTISQRRIIFWNFLKTFFSSRLIANTEVRKDRLHHHPSKKMFYIICEQN